MNRITIMLVRVRMDGETRLVGRTASDRWNLQVLGYDSLPDTRHQDAVKRLRREYGGEFSFRVSRGGGFAAWASAAEYDALGVGGYWVTSGHPAVILLDAA